MRSGYASFLLGALIFAAMARPAAAQSIRDDLRASSANLQIGRALGALSILGGTPGISAATFDADGATINTYKVPVSYSFPQFEGGPLAGAAPYVELTVGYLHLDQYSALDRGPRMPYAARFRLDAITGLAGAGLEFPLATATRLRVLGLAGYAHVDAHTRFYGPNSGLFQDIVKGILDEATTNSLLLGGAVELEDRRRFQGDLRLTSSLRLNHLVDSVQDSTDAALKTTNSFTVLTGATELGGPTGLRMLGQDLRWLGFGSFAWLAGESRRDLGFNSFAELGGGLELAGRGRLPWVERIGLRGSGILGDGVTGWSLGLRISF